MLSAVSNMHGFLPPGSNLKLDAGELKHFEKPFETFNIRNFAKHNKELEKSALPFDFNPVAEFSYSKEKTNYSKLNQHSCRKVGKLVNDNEYNLPLWNPFFPKYRPLQEPMVEAFPELYLVSDAIRFPVTCGLADTIECELFEGAPSRYDWTPQQLVLLQ